MLYVQVAAANCFDCDSTQTCLRELFYFECFLLLTIMLSLRFLGAGGMHFVLLGGDHFFSDCWAGRLSLRSTGCSGILFKS